jgi:hypothetical protein
MYGQKDFGRLSVKALDPFVELPADVCVKALLRCRPALRATLLLCQ